MSSRARSPASCVADACGHLGLLPRVVRRSLPGGHESARMSRPVVCIMEWRRIPHATTALLRHSAMGKPGTSLHRRSMFLRRGLYCLHVSNQTWPSCPAGQQHLTQADPSGARPNHYDIVLVDYSGSAILMAASDTVIIPIQHMQVAI